MVSGEGERTGLDAPPRRLHAPQLQHSVVGVLHGSRLRTLSSTTHWVAARLMA